MPGPGLPGAWRLWQVSAPGRRRRSKKDGVRRGFRIKANEIDAIKLFSAKTAQGAVKYFSGGDLENL
jgi:hypothetical protein